ncbi:hypothetical protein CLOACE_20520 [Clostridium acetireducens DSM 10703]|uniref:Uncharacterized protein n=1 Tax=Clostridium acetireducens DSM 10703 TaxID=1121290 RepID=A0A1E8EWG4_9CLOT|nr:hypothetical protein [Clostridium acetireducens]OFI01570.1 hypothetical protein CLOACE_20520 [Clostridium acetireducens DSM 10703]
MSYFKEDFINNYIKEKSKEIKKLEKSKNQYIAEIEKCNKIFKYNKLKYNKIAYNNKELADKYEKLKHIFYKRGIILYIRNKNYNVNEWDNLHLKLEYNNYYIYTKNNELLYKFHEEETSVIREMIYNKPYSLIITRIDGNVLKLQLRLKLVNK